jgi:RHS repeat-associated protein
MLSPDRQKATVTVSYEYDAVYYATPEDFNRSFALASGVPTAITREGLKIGLAQASSVDLGADSADGGWSLSAHHRWDATRGVLVRGDGTETRADAFGAIITTVAGNGAGGFSGDVGPATAARLNLPPGVTAVPDGSLVIADAWNNRIRRVGPDGTITTVAGNGVAGFSGDGGPATAASLYFPESIAVAADGSLYIADTGNHRIRRVGPDGTITTVAGNGVAGFSGDGGPATAASLLGPYGVAAGPDGSLYIADTNNSRIRRVGPDGTITTVAGNGVAGFSGDGGPATAASLYLPYGVGIAADGSLVIADTYNSRIRRVGPDGTITTVAGNGTWGFFGDGSLATAARLGLPYGVAAGPDGSVYIADADNHRIRRVGPDGLITTVAGNGGPGGGGGGSFSTAMAISSGGAGGDTGGFSGDGGLATAASLNYPQSVAVAPDGSLVIADTYNNRIRRLASTTGFNSVFVPSADGAEVYGFDSSGRHLRTLDALTGGTRYVFGYDGANRLISVTDGSGNVTTLERDGAGNPTAIVSPFGQRTELTLDGNGYLATIANPAGEIHRMQYTDDGLLTRFEDPRGNASTLTYDADGRLVRDANAAGGSQNLVQAYLTDGDWSSMQVTVTTAEGAATVYQIEDLPIGDQRRTVIQPDGTSTVSVTGTDGTTNRTGPDGTLSTSVAGPDPRFGMAAPVTTRQTVTTPGGLASSLAQARTANLTNPSDPLTLVSLTDTVTLNGRTATSVYTAATRTTTRTSAAGRPSTTVLDTLGRPILTQIAGLESVAYAYDARGRLATVTQGSGADARAVTFGYDAAGYLASLTDALGRSAGFAYDPVGRITRQIFPDGRAVEFGYDANGNLTSLTPPGRPAHAFTYTPVDLTAEYLPPAVGAGTNSTQYSYNRDKQLTQVRRPDGLAVDLDYDAAGRLSTLTVPEGAFGYGYHATSGHLSQITAPDGGALSFAYDGSLLTGATWTGAIAGRVGFGYDNDFRVTSVTVNGANPVAYAYDPDSLLVQVGGLTLSRDAQNGLLAGSTLGAVADTWSYNGFGEPATYRAAQGATALLDLAYTRDALGRITEKTESVGGVTATYAYGYDLAGRLVEVKKDGVVQTTWGYDANGNRTHVNGAEIAHYDAQDRLLDYAGATYEYTANGELQKKTQGGQVTEYTYDVLGNLRQVTLPDGRTLDYLTDGRNRRIGKKVGGALVQGFLWQDQLKPVAELDGAGGIVSRFVYATRVNVPDYLVKGGVTYRLVTDHLGSPRLVVNTVDGTVVQRMDYDAWGKVLLDTNPGFQPFGFAGGLYDRDTGLVRFGARDYDPGVGRWVAKDQLTFTGGDSNLYSYAWSEPINAIDPFGHAGWVTTAIGQYDAWAISLAENSRGRWWMVGLAFGSQGMSTFLDWFKYFGTGGDVFDALTDPCRDWLGRNGRIYDASVGLLTDRLAAWLQEPMRYYDHMNQVMINSGFNNMLEWRNAEAYRLWQAGRAFGEFADFASGAADVP